jgi:hypothetical protein
MTDLISYVLDAMSIVESKKDKKNKAIELIKSTYTTAFGKEEYNMIEEDIPMLIEIIVTLSKSKKMKMINKKINRLFSCV